LSAPQNWKQKMWVGAASNLYRKYKADGGSMLWNQFLARLKELRIEKEEEACA
jgi:hypothetical protein